MDCLIDYIGLTGCGTNTPASGLFINSLPGISLKSIDSLADLEQVNYIGVWNDVQTRAIKRLELYLMAELAKKVKIKSSKYQVSTIWADDPNVADQTFNNFVEIRLKSDCGSPLGYHLIDKINVNTTGSPDNYTVIIYDLDTKEELYNNVFSDPNGFAIYTININKKFYRQNIAIKMSNETGLYHYMPVQNIYHQCGSIEYGTSVVGTGVFSSSTQGYGFNLIGYSIGCDLNNLACTNRSIMALPLWYLCGAEMMMERITSNRVNFWTMDKKQAEELKAYFDVSAENALKLVYNGISMSDCDCCIECDPSISIREARL